MDSLKERGHQIISLFNSSKDWESKYRMIIKQGQQLKTLSEEDKDPSLLVKGCQSRVWLQARFKDGKAWFKGDSDALITKGLLALVLQYYSGLSPQEILKQEPQFIEQLGLIHHLTPSRGNGLMSLIKQIQLYAKAFELTHRRR